MDNITEIDTSGSTNVDWYKTGEKVSNTNMNRPIKDIAEKVNELISNNNGFEDDVNEIIATRVKTYEVLTTNELISSFDGSGLSIGDIVKTYGYYESGDGGHGAWRKVGNDSSLSKDPSSLGTWRVTDSIGSIYELQTLELNILQLGAIVDDVTFDNGDIIEIANDWSNTTNLTYVLPVGVTYSSYALLANNISVSVRGFGKDKSTFFLMDGSNNNAAHVINGGYLSITDMTIDQNYENQTAGHGIRSGGCERLHVFNTRVQNVLNYGIGFQGGTSKDVRINNVDIINTGNDAIDIKDYNLNNECIYIDNLYVSGHSRDDEDDCAIDARGEINANNISINATTDCIGVRFRQGGDQGRSGFGSYSNVVFHGNGIEGTYAIHQESTRGNFVNITAHDAYAPFWQSYQSTGGSITNLNAEGTTGYNGMLISGQNLLMNNVNIANADSDVASLLFNITGSASNVRISNINMVNNTDSTNSANIQTGATNIEIVGGFVSGNDIKDTDGTNTIDVTYI